MPLDNNISALLKKSFNNAGAISQKSLAEIFTVLGGCPPAFTETELLKKQPALFFEKEKGLKGLARQYTLPEGLKPHELEDVVLGLPLTSEALPVCNDIWRRLQTLNPDLAAVSVQTDDLHSLHYALTGVVSGFNADDIDFFLKYCREEPAYLKNLPPYQKLLNDIEHRVGAPYWVPAPTTLEKIKAQLDARTMVKHPSPQV